MTRAFHLCIETTGLFIGWLLLLGSLIFAFSALPILILTLFWM